MRMRITVRPPAGTAAGEPAAAAARNDRPERGPGTVPTISGAFLPGKPKEPRSSARTSGRNRPTACTTGSDTAGRRRLDHRPAVAVTIDGLVRTVMGRWGQAAGGRLVS